MRKFILILLFIIFLLNTNVLAFNSKFISQTRLEIIRSGRLFVNGNIEKIELYLYAPQEGLKEINVYPNNWEWIEDRFRNKMIKIVWDNPKGTQEYRVSFLVDNFAKNQNNFDTDSWFLEDSKKETVLTRSNSEIREFAYGKEDDLQKAFRLTKWIYKNLKYEFLPFKKQTLSSIDTWNSRKGTCGEFSNLLAAFLRSQGIPVRYVVGYSIPSENYTSEFISHAWIEVFYKGRWVPFDPTWMEAGYLDATHVKLANLLDSNFSEYIFYKGFGSVDWMPSQDEIKMIDYKEEIPFNFSYDVETKVSGGEAVLFNFTLNGNGAYLLKLYSCVDIDGSPVIQIKDPERIYYFNDNSVYWIVIPKKVESDVKLICPLRLFVNNKKIVEENIEIVGNNEHDKVLLSGESTARLGENVLISSPKKGLFFSPNFTESYSGKTYNFTSTIPGNYLIYFYFDNSYGEKLISFQKELFAKIKNIEIPNSTKIGENILLNFSLENLKPYNLDGIVEIKVGEKTYSKTVKLLPRETKNIQFNITMNETGFLDGSIIFKSLSQSYYSFSIYVEENSNKNIINKIVDFLNQLIHFLISFFR